MPLELPDDYSDTGIDKTFEYALSVAFENIEGGMHPSWVLYLFQFEIADWTITVEVETYSLALEMGVWVGRHPYTVTATCSVSGSAEPSGGAEVVETGELLFTAGNPAVPSTFAWTSSTDLGPYAITRNFGPLRLGVRQEQYLDRVMIANTPKPWYADYYLIRYAWFKDQSTIDEQTGPTGTFDAFEVPAPTVIESGPPQLLWGDGTTIIATNPLDPGLPAPGGSSVVLSDGEIDGWAFTVPSGYIHSGGAASPPWRFSYDLSVLKYDGNSYTGAQVLDNWLTVDATRTPYAAHVPLGTADYVGPVVSWIADITDKTVSPTTPEFVFYLDPVWLASVSERANDTNILLDNPIVRDGHAEEYYPITVRHRAAVEIDQPGGVRPSAWVAADAAKGSVSQPASSPTVFTVTAPTAFSRSLATNWRRYIDKAAATWEMEGYSILKAGYRTGAGYLSPEDVWWWNGYGFLKLNLTADVPALLTLNVQGIRLHVSDGHLTDSVLRKAGLVFTEYDESLTYAVEVTAGTHDYWIDLLFPAAIETSESEQARPVTLPRVDRVEIGIDTAGTFTVNSLELARRDSYANQTAISYSAKMADDEEDTLPDADDKWAGPYVRVDGSANPTLSFPDGFGQGQQQEEPDTATGGVAWGGSPRFVEPRYGVTNDHRVRTAREMWEDLDRIEGFSVEWDQTVADAATKDSYDVTIWSGDEHPTAMWAREVTPGTNWTGSGDSHQYQPALLPRTHRIAIVPGYEFLIRPRKILQGGVEAVAAQNDQRAPAGVDFNVVNSGGATIATVTTDARGRIHYEPLRDRRQVRFEEA